MKKIIIFGLWNVLGEKETSASKKLQKYFKIDLPREVFLRKYEESFHLKKWRSEIEMAKSFLKTFNLNESEENISFVINTIFDFKENSLLFPNIKNILEKLSKKYELYLFSNTTNYESEIINIWNLEKYFTKTFFSFQTKLLKPDVKAFENIINTIEIEVKNCIYIDDEKRCNNIAQELGFEVLLPNKIKNYFKI